MLKIAGIIFAKTQNLGKIVDFYINKLGALPWLSQPDIEIIRHDNLLIGFQQSELKETQGLFTFFYKEKADVDQLYEKLKSIATTIPKINVKYQIYNFFAKDPEGRSIEFQCFLHEIPPI